MGGICSKSSAKPPRGSTAHANGFGDHKLKDCHSGREMQADLTPPVGVTVGKQSPEQPFSFSSERTMPASTSIPTGAVDPQEPQASKRFLQKSRSARSKQAASAKTGATKVSERSSLLGRAGTVGLGKAVEVLDTLGSSMTNLNLSSGFALGATIKGNKISILAFEVANTIVKGATLMGSLSKENIKHLNELVLPSEGVQHLVSKDMDELLRIAASDKRDELKIFSGEVIRFGNRCKDPQWHNLDRYFDKLGSEFTPQSQLKEEAPIVMQQLMSLVQYTALRDYSHRKTYILSELYHELHALDRFEQDYRRKHQEENSTVVQKGDNLQILRQELKSQRKHVKCLKKRSLWSKNLEEVMEKLVDIVHFIHLEIHNAFGISDGGTPLKQSINAHQKLGPAGLALHYANIISQIDSLVSRSSSVPPNTRDTLYQGLPLCIKYSLRSKLQSFQLSEEITIPQIKAEMERTLRWLVPIANNTTKAHHGFGWVGEWANTGSELNQKPAGQSDLIRIETLHHADKAKTESYILDLVVWLHHLISLSKAANGGGRSPIRSPLRSPTQTGLSVTLPSTKPGSQSSVLTQEDQEMLRDVTFRKLTPGISKSQEFNRANCRLNKLSRLSRSSNHSPTDGNRREFIPLRRPSMVPVIDFNFDRLKALDVIDRVDDLM